MKTHNVLNCVYEYFTAGFPFLGRNWVYTLTNSYVHPPRVPRSSAALLRCVQPARRLTTDCQPAMFQRRHSSSSFLRRALLSPFLRPLPRGLVLLLLLSSSSLLLSCRCCCFFSCVLFVEDEYGYVCYMWASGRREISARTKRGTGFLNVYIPEVRRERRLFELYFSDFGEEHNLFGLLLRLAGFDAGLFI